MMNKTNVMRLLDAAHIDYVPHEYDNSVTDGETVARLVGIPAERVFKTLVTEGGERRNFVFVVPVGKTLDDDSAKEAAAAYGLYPRRLFADRDEKDIPDLHRRVRRGF